MRSIGQKRREEESDESVFVPMTDMTVSFLFIVMILLAFFAVQFSDEDNVSRSVYEVVVNERNDLVTEVKQLNIEIQRLKDLIIDIKRKNSELENQKQALTVENSRLDRDLTAALNLILKLKDEISELANKNLDLNKTLSVLSKELDEIKSLLKKRDQRIDLLESRIRSLEVDLELVKKKNDELAAEVEKMQELIRDLYKEINDLFELIDEKDELLRTRNDIIISLKRTVSLLLEQAEKKDQEILNLVEQVELLKALLKDDPLELYLLQSQQKRSRILSEIERKLKIKFPDILVEVSPENDALRFKGDGLFASGSSQLSVSKKEIIENVGALIVDEIGCYTLNPKKLDYQVCNPDGILIEAIQIEGHTDNSRFVVDGRDRNIELSAKRAESAFFAMKNSQPSLLTYKNLKNQPVMSIAGYGDMRPVNTNPLMKAENRRIDIRLIMFTPTGRDQVNNIQERIERDLEIMLEEIE